MTIEEIRDALGATEPDYPRLAAELGVDSLTQLKSLVLSDDVRIASKAVYLAAMIKGPMSAEILRAAAGLPNQRMRVAVGAAAADLDLKAGAELLGRLLKDADAGVRHIAMRSIETVKGFENEGFKKLKRKFKLD